MTNSIARIISYLFNPYFLLLPIPYLLVLRQTQDPIYSLKWTIISLLFVGVVGLNVVYFVWKGEFTDLDISRREQRPFFFTILFIYSLFFLVSLIIFNGPLVLYIALAGIFLSIFVFSFLNRRLKASIHVASISALIFAFSALYGGVFLLLLFLIPLIAWARVRIKRHTIKEAVVGGITGIMLVTVMYLFFKLVLGVSITNNL